MAAILSQPQCVNIEIFKTTSMEKESTVVAKDIWDMKITQNNTKQDINILWDIYAWINSKQN